MHVDPHHRFVRLLVNFCWRRDHLEYVSLVLLGGFHGLVTFGNGCMPCNIAQIYFEFLYSLV